MFKNIMYKTRCVTLFKLNVQIYNNSSSLDLDKDCFLNKISVSK